MEKETSHGWPRHLASCNNVTVSSLVACLTTLLTAAAAFAQSAADENVVRAVAPLADADLARHGIVLSDKEGDPNASLFEWRRTKLPLQVPRDRASVGLVDPDLVVVLAGGVRHPLVVYFVDAGGAIARLVTDDGRRLPAAFNDGAGSWPVAVGRGVFVVAFEKNGRFELHAVSFGDQVLAKRSLPSTATGFQVEVDPSVQKIRVQPLGVEEARPLEFVHPRAPRVQFDQVVVDFGSVVVGATQTGFAKLRNPSDQLINIAIKAEGAFRAHSSALSLQPGASLALPVTFIPSSDDEQRGRLVVQHAGLERPLVLALRGFGVKPSVTEVAALSMPRRAEWSASSSTGVTGSEASSLQDSTTQPSVDPARVNRVADLLLGQPSGPERSAVVPACPEPMAPHVARRDDVVIVSGEAGEVLTLVLVGVYATDQGARPLRPLGAWRAQLSVDDGTLRVGLESLLTPANGEAEGVGLVALRQGALRVTSSNLLQIKPVRQ